MLRSIICFIRAVISKRMSDPILYIGGNDALPTPLTREEEIVAVKAYMNGDLTARDNLREKNYF